jgi:hypothetical protein
MEKYNLAFYDRNDLNGFGFILCSNSILTHDQDPQIPHYYEIAHVAGRHPAFASDASPGIHH